MIYWITGRRNAGKTTLAYELKRALETIGRKVLLLDGDEVRAFFETGYSDKERYEHIMRIAKIAALAERQGFVVIIALVSPRAAWRIEASKLFQRYTLIYIEGGELWEGTYYEEPLPEENARRLEAWNSF